MDTLLNRIIGDSKEGKARALPRDHRVVHGGMASYLWRSTTEVTGQPTTKVAE